MSRASWITLRVGERYECWKEGVCSSLPLVVMRKPTHEEKALLIFGSREEEEKKAFLGTIYVFSKKKLRENQHSSWKLPVPPSAILSLQL